MEARGQSASTRPAGRPLPRLDDDAAPHESEASSLGHDLGARVESRWIANWPN